MSGYCIYAMVHRSSESASNAKIEECILSSGEKAWHYVPTNALIQNTDSWPNKYDALALKFREAVHLYSSVVPSVLLSELSKDIEGQVQLIKRLDQPDEVKSVQAILYQENYNLLRKLIEIKSNYEKDVKKEPSRNDFCYQHLKMALQELGFIPKRTIEQCDICIHGKSLLDMYFYKDGGAVVKSAILRKFESLEDNALYGGNSGVVAGVTEFKCSGKLKTYFAQTLCRYDSSWLIAYPRCPR